MRVQIEHRIGVQAPASNVWLHLADLEAWSGWNPMYPEASGVLRIGAALTLKEIVPGQEPKQIAPVVVDWVPNAQIIWMSKTRVVRRTRYMEIQALTDDGCVFSNGEIYEGLGARFVSRDLRRALRQGFTEMGEAMKMLAEGAGPEGARNLAVKI